MDEPAEAFLVINGTIVSANYSRTIRIALVALEAMADSEGELATDARFLLRVMEVPPQSPDPAQP